MTKMREYAIRAPVSYPDHRDEPRSKLILPFASAFVLRAAAGAFGAALSVSVLAHLSVLGSVAISFVILAHVAIFFGVLVSVLLVLI